MFIQYLRQLQQTPLFRDSFWALFGNVINKALGLFAGILIARFLGKELYGEYGLIKNTLLYIAVFSTFGLGFTATRFIAQSGTSNIRRVKEVIDHAILITSLFSMGIALAFFVFATDIAIYLEAPDISLAFKYTAFVIVFNALTTTQIGILAGLHRFKTVARNNTIVGIVTVISSVVLTYLYELNGAILALLIANGVNCFLNYFTIRTEIQGQHPFKFSKKKFNELIRFSFPIALQECSVSLLFVAGPIVLIKYADYCEMGLFSAAAQWSTVIMFIPHVLQNVALSHLSSTGEQKETHERTFKTLVKINLVSTCIPISVVLCCSAYIVSLYGETYEGLQPVLIAIVLKTLIDCILQIYFQEFIAIGLTWTILIVRLVRDLLNLGLVYLLLNTIEGHGALLYVCAAFAANLLCLISIYPLHRTKLEDLRLKQQKC